MMLDLGPGDTVVVPSFTFTTHGAGLRPAGRPAAVLRHRAAHAGPRPGAPRDAARRHACARSCWSTTPGSPATWTGIRRVLADRPDVAVIEDNAHGLFGTLARRAARQPRPVLGAELPRDQELHLRRGRRAAAQRGPRRRPGPGALRQGHQPARVPAGPGRQVLLEGHRLVVRAVRRARGVPAGPARAARRRSRPSGKASTSGTPRLLAPHAADGHVHAPGACRRTASRPTTCSTCCCPTASAATRCCRRCARRASSRRSTTCRCTARTPAGCFAARHDRVPGHRGHQRPPAAAAVLQRPDGADEPSGWSRPSSPRWPPRRRHGLTWPPSHPAGSSSLRPARLLVVPRPRRAAATRSLGPYLGQPATMLDVGSADGPSVGWMQGGHRRGHARPVPPRAHSRRGRLRVRDGAAVRGRDVRRGRRLRRGRALRARDAGDRRAGPRAAARRPDAAVGSGLPVGLVRPRRAGGPPPPLHPAPSGRPRRARRARASTGRRTRSVRCSRSSSPSGCSAGQAARPATGTARAHLGARPVQRLLLRLSGPSSGCCAAATCRSGHRCSWPRPSPAPDRRLLPALSGGPRLDHGQQRERHRLRRQEAPDHGVLEREPGQRDEREARSEHATEPAPGHRARPSLRQAAHGQHQVGHGHGAHRWRPAPSRTTRASRPARRPAAARGGPAEPRPPPPGRPSRRVASRSRTRIRARADKLPVTTACVTRVVSWATIPSARMYGARNSASAANSVVTVTGDPPASASRTGGAGQHAPARSAATSSAPARNANGLRAAGGVALGAEPQRRRPAARSRGARRPGTARSRRRDWSPAASRTPAAGAAHGVLGDQAPGDGDEPAPRAEPAAHHPDQRRAERDRGDHRREPGVGAVEQRVAGQPGQAAQHQRGDHRITGSAAGALRRTDTLAVRGHRPRDPVLQRERERGTRERPVAPQHRDRAGRVGAERRGW